MTLRDYQYTLPDGRIFGGNIIGTDEMTDLAVVKLNSTETLPFAELGDSNDLKIGQVTIAIGNPFGLTGEHNSNSRNS